MSDERKHCWHPTGHDISTAGVRNNSGWSSVQYCRCGISSDRRRQDAECTIEGHGPFVTKNVRTYQPAVADATPCTDTGETAT